VSRSEAGGSSDARWFAVGVALVGGIIALASLGGESVAPLLPTGESVQSSPSVAKTEASAEEASEVSASADDAQQPVLARGLEPVEPEVLADRERTPDELLTLAREAFERGRSTDAYRYATLSATKRRTAAALEIKAKAACRLGGKGAARIAVGSLRGSRAREVRRECRKHGIWLAL